MKLKLILTAAVVGVVASLLGVQTAAAATPNICVATNGEVRVQKGTATCDASGTGSVAIAIGDLSRASTSGGNHNLALVIGDLSTAFAGTGDKNTAIVHGDGSAALAQLGDNNTATVTGDGSGAVAGARPGGFGDNNTATVRGDGSQAIAAAFAGCTAEAIGDGVSDFCP